MAASARQCQLQGAPRWLQSIAVADRHGKIRARTEFYYFNDDGEVVAYRYKDFKIVFCEQRKPGGFEVWANPFTCLRAPKIFNLRMDPFERADVVSDQYYDWMAKNAYLIQYGVWRVAPFLQTFKEFPPSQRSASFSIDQMVDALMKTLDLSFKTRGLAK